MNYYVAGAIVNQKNGLPPHTLKTQTFNNNGTGLTSVGYLGDGGNGGPNNTGFYGLDGTSNYAYGSSNAALLLFSQKGQDASGNETPIGANVGPKGLTVTLTLVPATPSTPANK